MLVGDLVFGQKYLKERINQPAFKPINQVFDTSIPVSPCHSSKTMLAEATYWTIQYLHPPKFNMAPEEWWLEDEFPFGIVNFWGVC